MRTQQLSSISESNDPGDAARPTHAGALDFLNGLGEMGAIMRLHDWSATALGWPAGWPQPLRTAVRLILTTRHPMYIWWGPEGACLYNDAYRASIGPERHPGSLGRPVREVWSEIWDIIGPQIEQVMAGGPATWHENQLVPITRHGRREDVYWTYSYGPIDDPDSANGIGGVLVVCSETTATVLAERERAAQADRQQRLFEQAPSFMAMLEGPQHRIMFANAAYKRLVGGRKVIGRTVAEALPEAVAQGYLETLDEVYRSGVAFTSANGKFVIAATDGAPEVERNLEFVYQPITDAEGQITGIFVEGNDVSQWVRAESALRASEIRLHEMNLNLERLVAERAAELQASEARLRTIFETSYQLQGLIAIDGTLLDANATSLSVIDSPKQAVIGRKFWDTPWFAATPFMAEMVAARVAAAARGEATRLELSLQLPSGLRSFDFSMRPIRGADGTVIAIVPEAVDITDRRLAEESLRQSQKLEAMGQLTGGVAHDFNNLLTPIIGSLDLLIRGGVGTERQQRLITGAMKSAERAKMLVQRLLAFARRQPLQFDAVDVSGLIGGMADLISSTLGPRISVVVQTEPDLPAVKADANQLEMAILNLSVNARDAMAEGGYLLIAAAAKTLRASHRSGLPPGRYVCIAVTDTGVGMDAATARRAIEPFFSTKGVGQGTGLGLSMVHGLAAQMGGALTIASEPGHGTTVELWLEVSEARAPSERRAAATEREVSRRGTALLVDDEELVRNAAADMLLDLGFTVIEAASAEAAMRIIDSEQAIDVVITDHLMPGMSGVELARASLRLRPDVAVLVVSGFAEMEGIAPDLPRLTKPFRQVDLAAVLAGLRAG
jgi:signal transduction histidine kinase/CheY-like chemotaxis protein